MGWFFEPVRIHRGRGSVRRQIKSGLRLGIGAGMWLIALMLMGSGLTRIVGAETYHSVAWADWMGWLELAAACALFMLAAHIWYMLVAGYLLFGFVKILIFLISGKNLYAPHVFLPRLEAAVQAGFALLTLVLLFRLSKIRLTIVDRTALTVYMFTFFPFGNIPAQSLGVAALAISWGIDRLTKGRKNAITRQPSHRL